MKVNGMQPVIEGSPSVLILGSMPGRKSLDQQMYYANPRNHFWSIMSDFFGDDLTEISYETRKIYLTTRNIALWDILQECERTGSLDSSIRHEKFNPVHQLIETCPSIQAIGCNGTKAYQSLLKYEKETKQLKTEIIKLPSTSPVPGKNVMNYHEKCLVWHQFLKSVIKGNTNEHRK